MRIENFIPFSGDHCETTATGTLLKQLDIDLSEPMLFGLGQGLGFIFWKMKSMDFPFIGGRIKTDLLTQNIARNLSLELVTTETTSARKAWDEVKALLDRGQAVGLKLDCFHLNYFSRPIHFAGHYVAIYGYDDRDAFLVDTRQQGTLVKTSLESLARARAEKGPMASKNLYYYLRKTNNQFDLKTALVSAIRKNATDYIHPHISNIGYKGILKTSKEIFSWFETTKDIAGDFNTTAVLMEKAGTGGALFRNLYRDFLKQSDEVLKLDKLKKGHEAMVEIAARWTTVAQLFGQISTAKDYPYIEQASTILKTISQKEKSTMEMLATL